MGRGAGETEARRHDADDFPHVAVDTDAPPHDVGFASEPALPEGVAQDYDGIRSRIVVVGNQRAPDERRRPQQAEQIGRDKSGAGPLGFSLTVRECHASTGIRGDRLHRLGGVLVIHIFRRSQAELGKVETALRQEPSPHAHEAIRVRVGQRIQQHAVHDAEDGRVRADAECQGDDHGQGEDRTGDEGSDGVANVPDDSSHGLSSWCAFEGILPAAAGLTEYAQEGAARVPAAEPRGLHPIPLRGGQPGAGLGPVHKLLPQVSQNGLAEAVGRRQPGQNRLGETRWSGFRAHELFPSTDSRPCRRLAIASWAC